jgi:hypothetical protein
MLKYILLSLAFFSLETYAAETVLSEAPLSSLGAGSDRTSDKMKTTRATMGSVHCTWASLTGTTDGQFLVDVSNNGTSWVAKAGAAITVASANGDDLISLNGVVTEAFYRVRWVKNNVTGGTVTCLASFKG